MIEKRQYRIMDLKTGDVTVAWWPVRNYFNSKGHVNTDPVGSYEVMCRELTGLRWMVECQVSLVAKGQEIDLPFDEIPLVLRFE